MSTAPFLLAYTSPLTICVTSHKPRSKISTLAHRPSFQPLQFPQPIDLVATLSSSSRIMSGVGRLGGVSTSVSENGGDSHVFALSGTSVLIINKGDITKWSVDGSSDAIVNPANEMMLGGGGADGAIHRAAGPELLNACYTVPEVQPGVRCPSGEARITPSFKLPSLHVIHTVGPIYVLDSNPAATLKLAYRNSLVVAKANSIQYIAFPALSCGIFGYPVEEAAAVALYTVKEFPDDFKEVHFVLLADDIYDVWLKKAKELLQPQFSNDNLT